MFQLKCLNDRFSHTVIHVYYTCKSTVARKDKTLLRIQTHTRFQKTLPRIENMSQIPKTFPRIQSTSTESKNTSQNPKHVRIQEPPYKSEVWKKYPLLAKPPHIGLYRECQAVNRLSVWAKGEKIRRERGILPHPKACSQAILPFFRYDYLS